MIDKSTEVGVALKLDNKDEIQKSLQSSIMNLQIVVCTLTASPSKSNVISLRLRPLVMCFSRDTGTGPMNVEIRILREPDFNM